MMKHNIVEVMVYFYFVDKDGEDCIMGNSAVMCERGTNPELKNKYARNNVLRDIIEKDYELQEAKKIQKIEIFWDDNYCSTIEVWDNFGDMMFDTVRTVRV